MSFGAAFSQTKTLATGSMKALSTSAEVVAATHGQSMDIWRPQHRQLQLRSTSTRNEVKESRSNNDVGL